MLYLWINIYNQCWRTRGIGWLFVGWVWQAGEGLVDLAVRRNGECTGHSFLNVQLIFFWFLSPYDRSECYPDMFFHSFSCFCQYSRGESWSHLLHPEILFSMLHDRGRHLLSVAWLYLTDILALYKVEAASLILSSVVLRCHRCISVCLPSYLASTWSLLLSHRRAIKKNTVQQNVQKTWCYYPAVDQVGATETCAGDFTMVSRVHLNTTTYVLPSQFRQIIEPHDPFFASRMLISSWGKLWNFVGLGPLGGVLEDEIGWLFQVVGES